MRWLVVLAFLAAPAAAADTSLAALSLTDIVAKIDATSFPNSIGPRRQAGLKTFADYGFTEVEFKDKAVELYEPDRSWMFAITVLETGNDHLVLCVLDRALGGPTYHAQSAETFVPGETGLLIATGEDVTDERCPERP